MTPRERANRALEAGTGLIQDYTLVRAAVEAEISAAEIAATKALREELKLADIASEQLAEQCARLNDEAIALEKRAEHSESASRALVEALEESARRVVNECSQRARIEAAGVHPWDLPHLVPCHCVYSRRIILAELEKARAALAAHEERSKKEKENL